MLKDCTFSNRINKRPNLRWRKETLMQSGKRGINLQRAEACCTRGSMFTPLLVMEAAVHQRRLCRDFQYGPVYVQRDMLFGPVFTAAD